MNISSVKKILIAILVVSVFVILMCYQLKSTPHEIIYSSYYKDIYPEEPYVFACSTPLILLVPIYNSNASLLRKRVEHLMSHVKTWDVYVYGLDSTDPKTLRDLHTWQNENQHVHLVNPVEHSPKRLVRMSQIRNALLDAIPDNTPENTIVMMYDGDHKGPLSKRGMADAVKNLKSHKEWFAVSASGTVSILPAFHLIYDVFAYRDKEGVNKIPRMHNLLPDYNPVQSSYSGACLYRYSELRQFRYPLDEHVCEHVSLHELMRKSLNKSMVMSKAFHIYVGIQKSN
jgi:hypothetical protein